MHRRKRNARLPAQEQLNVLPLCVSDADGHELWSGTVLLTILSQRTVRRQRVKPIRERQAKATLQRPLPKVAIRPLDQSPGTVLA